MHTDKTCFISHCSADRRLKHLHLIWSIYYLAWMSVRRPERRRPTPTEVDPSRLDPKCSMCFVQQWISDQLKSLRLILKTSPRWGKALQMFLEGRVAIQLLFGRKSVRAGKRGDNLILLQLSPGRWPRWHWALRVLKTSATYTNLTSQCKWKSCILSYSSSHGPTAWPQQPHGLELHMRQPAQKRFCVLLPFLHTALQ